MLPLGGPSFPTNRDELISSVTEGLAAVFQMPGGRPRLLDVGDGYPELDRLHIDMTGAALRPDYRPAPPDGPRQPGVTVADLRVEAHPLCHGQAPVEFELSAGAVRFEIARDARGRGLLLLVEARNGHLLIHVDTA